MIIACPACTTRYVVPDSAIGVEGRTVRCAKCRHSWFQDGPSLQPESSGSARRDPDARPGFGPGTGGGPSEPPSEPAPKPSAVHTGVRSGASKPHAAQQVPQQSPQQSPQQASQQTPEQIPPHSGPATTGASARQRATDHAQDNRLAEAPVSTPAVVETPPEHDIIREGPQDVSPFAHEPPFRGRRNPIKIWTAAAAAFAIIALGTVIAVSYYGLPDWVPVSRSYFGPEQPDLVLDFPADQQDRRTLPNGTELFGASGTITNVGRETRSVPSIMIVMRNQRDMPVYSWEVVPPKATLAPGESVTINEAVINVPKSAKFAEIGWKADR